MKDARVCPKCQVPMEQTGMVTEGGVGLMDTKDWSKRQSEFTCPICGDIWLHDESWNKEV